MVPNNSIRCEAMEHSWKLWMFLVLFLCYDVSLHGNHSTHVFSWTGNWWRHLVHSERTAEWKVPFEQPMGRSNTDQNPIPGPSAYCFECFSTFFKGTLPTIQWSILPEPIAQYIIIYRNTDYLIMICGIAHCSMLLSFPIPEFVGVF